MYGHVQTLAREIGKGVEKSGAVATLLQVPETLPREVLQAMRAPEKAKDIKEVTTSDLATFDGIIFGFPTRFGMASAQMKAFLDTTGGLWFKQALANKTGGLFFSTGTQGGGQETTAMTYFSSSDCYFL